MSDTGAGNEEKLKEFGAALAAGVGPSVMAHEVAFGELTLIAKAEDIVGLLTYLRDDPRCKFTTLADIFAVLDYPASVAAVRRSSITCCRCIKITASASAQCITR